MPLDAQLLSRIEQPEDPILQDLFREACEDTRERLESWGTGDVDDWVLRKLTFTYYYDSARDDPDYVFLLQDPGGLQKRHTEELEAIRQLKSQFSATALVDVYRQFAKTWLLRRNEEFSRQFFTTLDDLDVISLTESWDQYLRNDQFFTDFYLADVVKYRTDGFTKRQEQASVEAFLQDELQAIDPDLIFSFGGKAWSAVQNHLDTRPVGQPTVDTDKITDVHGHLCKSHRLVETHILPLSHMSGQIWWRFPPEDYIARLRTGITQWQDHG